MLAYFVAFCNPYPVRRVPRRRSLRRVRPWRRLRPLLLGLAWGGCCAASASVWQAYGPHLLLNLTASVPRGLYVRSPLTPLSPLTYGMLVAFPPPASVASVAVRRGYLAPQIPLLKPLAALPGETVCVHDHGVVIQGSFVAPIALADTLGRPLPRWRGCVTLGPNEVFPLSPAPRSFDGRYFGPVAVADLLGQAFPVLTWGAWEAGSGTGERGQDKDEPGEATLPKQNQALGTRQAEILPADRLTALFLQSFAPRHHVVAGEE